MQRYPLPVCLVAVAIDYIGVSMMRTLLPFRAKSLAGEHAPILIGSLESAYGVGQIIGAMILGRVSDRYGRKVVLIISFVGSMIGYSMAAVATTPQMLLLSRLPIGLAKQTVAVARAIVADCTTSSDRSAVMARLTALMAMGYAVGPLIGGYLGELWGDAAPAFVAVGLFALLVPIVLMFLPETSRGLEGGDSRKDKGIPKSSSKEEVSREQVERNPRAHIFWILVVLVLPEFSVVSYSATGLSVLVQSIGKGRAFLGSVNSATAALAAVCSGLLIPYLSKKRGVTDRTLLIIGICLFACASAFLALNSSSFGVVACIPIFACALSVLRSCPPSFLSKEAPETMQGEAMGYLDSVSSLCRVVAPLIAGVVAERGGPGAPFAVCAAMCVSGLFALLLLIDVDSHKQHKKD